MTSALWIDSDSVSGAYDAVIRHPAIVASAGALIERGRTPSRVPAGRGLYVFERECAALPRTAARTLGSDRATTCHILIALTDRSAFAVHLNGVPGQTLALLRAMREVFGEASDVDVHIAGGFDDPAGRSRMLGADLFRCLAHPGRAWPDVRFHLRTACVGPLNSALLRVRRPGRTEEIETPGPLVRALAVDVGTGEVIPNGWFDDLGPDAAWRMAAASYSTAPLHTVTDPATGRYRENLRTPLEVPPREVLAALLGITDDGEFLRYTSTSPEVEHATFAAEVRAGLRLMLSLASS